MKKEILILCLIICVALVGGCSSASEYADSVISRTDEGVTDGSKGGPGSGGHPKGGFFKNVNKEVTQIDNGIIIEITTDDPEILAKIQGFTSGDHHGPKGFKPSDSNGEIEVNKEVELIENGIRTTITSDNEEYVQRIKDRSESGTPGPKGMRGGFKGKDGKHGGRPGYFSEIDMEFILIENGIIIEMTSTNPEVFQKMVDKHERVSDGDHKKSHRSHDDVDTNKVVEILDDMIRVTITSDDPDVVAKIQEKADYKGPFPH